MTEEPLRKCPNCGLDTLVRVVTGGAGVLYKGEGWYVTDYSHKSSGGKDDGSAPAATPAPLPKDSSAGPVAPPAEPLGAT